MSRERLTSYVAARTPRSRVRLNFTRMRSSPPWEASMRNSHDVPVGANRIKQQRSSILNLKIGLRWPPRCCLWRC
jgi:hypothetical protein